MKMRHNSPDCSISQVNYGTDRTQGMIAFEHVKCYNACVSVVPFGFLPSGVHICCRWMTYVAGFALHKSADSVMCILAGFPSPNG